MIGGAVMTRGGVASASGIGPSGCSGISRIPSGIWIVGLRAEGGSWSGRFLTLGREGWSFFWMGWVDGFRFGLG